MSAPYSKGFNIADVVNVASTINGIPFECAISDRADMSATTNLDLLLFHNILL